MWRAFNCSQRILQQEVRLSNVFPSFNVCLHVMWRQLKGNSCVFQPGIIPINVTIVTLGGANFALGIFVVEIQGKEDSHKTTYIGTSCASLPQLYK